MTRAERLLDAIKRGELMSKADSRDALAVVEAAVAWNNSNHESWEDALRDAVADWEREVRRLLR